MTVVREALLPLQRKVAAQGNVILAGRDIGTVVLPEADLKLYIDASLSERARRRHLQMMDAGKEADLDTVVNDMQRRDKIDTERSLAPLTRAEDAIYILTDNKTIDDVMQEIIQIIEHWTAT
jgi:cytidylate kinase